MSFILISIVSSTVEVNMSMTKKIKILKDIDENEYFDIKEGEYTTSLFIGTPP